MNCSRFITQEANNGTCSEFKTYEVGMQVSCSMDTEIQKEDVVPGIAEILRFNIQGTSVAEGMFGYRRASFARSYSHADFYTTQVFGFTGNRLY